MVYYLFPILIGTMAVLQATLNRSIGMAWGLSSAIFFNGVVFFISTGFLFLVVKFLPHYFPELMHAKVLVGKLKWWFVLPGIFGFLFVLGMPLSIHKLGPFKVFIMFIASQLAMSLIWDHYVLGSSLHLKQVFGLFMVLVGAVFIFL